MQYLTYNLENNPKLEEKMENKIIVETISRFCEVVGGLQREGMKFHCREKEDGTFEIVVTGY